MWVFLLCVDGKLYNVAAALNRGEVLGLTTKTFLPNYGEFYEMRQFTPGPDTAREILFDGEPRSLWPSASISGNNYGGTDRIGRDLRGCVVPDSAEHSGGDGGSYGDRELFCQR